MRKLAGVWTQRFFAGVAAKLHQPLRSLVAEPVARGRAARWARTGGPSV